MTFTTAQAADTTAPIISAVASGSVASTTAQVTWTTDEAASSKVYYQAGASLDFAAALSVSDSSLALLHTSNLTGLTASTTYQYAVVSADAAGNTATSSTQSFVTGS
jgi:hypothetical protein